MNRTENSRGSQNQKPRRNFKPRAYNQQPPVRSKQPTQKPESMIDLFREYIREELKKELTVPKGVTITPSFSRKGEVNGNSSCNIRVSYKNEKGLISSVNHGIYYIESFSNSGKLTNSSTSLIIVNLDSNRILFSNISANAVEKSKTYLPRIIQGAIDRLIETKKSDN